MMDWIYTLDEGGIKDHPKFGYPLVDYWTNEDNVRIGYYGRGKSITIFTYRGRGLWFCFNLARTHIGDQSADRNDYTGDLGNAYIELDDFKSYDEQQRSKVIADISQFLLIYRCPRALDEPPITKIMIC